MKKSIKRLSALLLTLCMLASLMVPVAFANTETETPSVDAAETYQIRVKDLTNTDPTITDGIEGLFTDGTSFINNAVNKVISKTPGFYDTYGWKFYAVKDSLGYRYDQMYMARLGYNDWAALQINVSEAGLYALNLKTDKTVDTETESTPWTNASSAWTGDVSAYIIPLGVVDAAVAAGTTTSTDDEGNEVVTAPAAADVISDLMIDEYSVGTVNMAADVDNITFAKTRMEAGEYVVVYAAVGNFAISEMSLLETAEDAAKFEMSEIANYGIQYIDSSKMTAEEVYNSGLPGATRFVTATTVDDVTTYAFVAESTGGVKISKISSASYYDNNKLNWKWLETDASYRPNFNFQLRLDTGKTIAFQIKVPTSGIYALTLSTAGEDTYSADAYVLNVNDVPADNTSYLDLAVAANSIGSAAVTADKPGVFNTKYYAEGEYVVILSNTTGANFPICAMGLSQYAIDALPENEEVVIDDVTYNFDLFNTERYAPIFTDAEGATANKKFTNMAASGLDGVYEAGTEVGTILSNDYANDKINWKLADAGTMSVLTFEPSNTGLRIRNSASGVNQYAAFCIDVADTAMYTVDLVTNYNDAALNVYVYDADAEGTVADNMTAANLVGSYADSATEIYFSKVLSAGENIIVFEIPGTDKNETFKLNSIVLSVNNDPSSISFDLSTNEAYIAAIKEASGNNITEITWGADANMNKIEYTCEETTTDETTGETTTATVTKSVNPYAVLATMFTSGQIDWALDSAVMTNTPAVKFTYPYEGYMRLRIAADGNGYAALRIRINNAGVHNITVNATSDSGANTAYLFPATNTYTTYSASCMDVTPYMTDAYKLGDAADSKGPITGSYNFESAGEYVLVLANTNVPESGKNNIYLYSMELEPVDAAVYADGVAYTSFEAAIEKATDSVVLNENVAAGDLVVPAGVTLDLNGYALYANSVDAKNAPGAQIIDSTDGNGVIRGDVLFAEDNAQLPLLDVDADGYRLFKVDVNAVTTTGSGNATKYWFKVNFSNSDVFELIGANTELRIMADMTGVYSNKVEDLAGQAFAAEATAPVSFTNAWAAKNTSYIVVSAVGSSGVDSFQLFPAVTANGVVISGDAMTKG